MVFDNIKNAEKYFALHKNFEKAFEFIKKAVAENLAPAKYEIDGEDVFAPVSEYETNPVNNGEYEAHRDYIDLQFLVKGEEKIDVIEISKAYSVKEYVKDVEFFKSDEKATSLMLKEGDFAILYPEDLHIPGLSYDGNVEKVKKIVVKVKI